ncbi:MAG: alpha/beta hydrolase, partial [Candidatus Competibacteraceae bacterium]|nr:alpha/beta hydrolase [Candidatus Competibacteraceae bacterium]
QEGWRDELRRRFQEVGDGILDFAKDMFGLSAIADAVLASKLEDLSRYYQEDAIRRELRGRLMSSLERHIDNGDRIMVIAHSMGSIIAYDVLRELGRQRPSARVDHFITIGSPLGLPHVMFHHMEEFDAVRTPTVVKRWTNFADRRDIVSLDTHLSDDYAPNVEGVRVVDDLVFNGYMSTRTEKDNPHKSYGYLRTPELSQAVRQFI